MDTFTSGLESRVCVLGEIGCGKSSLLDALTGCEFSERYDTTLGIRQTVRMFPSREDPKQRNVEVIVDDSSGEERFRFVTSGFLMRSRCVLICFDLSSQDSFDEARHLWLPWAKAHEHAIAKLLLVGLKADRGRQVPKKAIRKLAKEFHLEYFKTSARAGKGVEELAKCIGSCLRRKSMLALEFQDNRQPEQQRILTSVLRRLLRKPHGQFGPRSIISCLLRSCLTSPET